MAVRRLAFYGFLGSGNLGNDASLETVLAWFLEHHPQLELSCITLAPEVVRQRYGLPAVPLAVTGPAGVPSAASTVLRMIGTAGAITVGIEMVAVGVGAGATWVVAAARSASAENTPPSTRRPATIATTVVPAVRLATMMRWSFCWALLCWRLS